MAGADEVSFLAVTLGNTTDEGFFLAITRRKTTGAISPPGAITKIITAGHIKPSFFMFSFALYICFIVQDMQL